ncbi:DDE-domain-containing protein, partial [Tuber magnatum]
WHLRFLKRYSELDAKYSRQIEQKRTIAKQDYFTLSHFYDKYREAITKYNLKPTNIYNIDEIGSMLGFVQAVKVITSKLREHETLVSYLGGREMIMVLEAICLDGSFLENPIIIFKGDGIEQCWVENESCSIPDGVLIGHSPNGWTDNKKSLAYLAKFFGPESFTVKKAAGEYRMLLFDGHGFHVSWQFLSYCLSHKIISFCLPPHTSHRLQPLDVAVFSHFKRYYSNRILERCKFGDHGVTKENFCSILGPARMQAFTNSNISSGFRATGLYLLDPLCILSTI